MEESEASKDIEEAGWGIGLSTDVLCRSLLCHH